MRNWLQRLLGIDELNRKIDSMAHDLSVYRAEMTALWADDINPTRKAASDALASKQIDRLIAEDKARRHTTGDL